MCYHEEQVIGVIAFSFANLLFFYANYLQSTKILLPKMKKGPFSTFSTFLFLTSQIIFIYTILVYWRAGFGNPGYFPKKLKSPGPKKYSGIMERTCKKCKDAWKPKRAYHCKVCNRCVFKMDHHCVWVNNCVGALNGKFFAQFLISTVIWISGFLFNTLFGISVFFGWIPGTNKSRIGDIHEDEVMSIVLYVITIAFGCFFIYFAYDFYDDFMSGIYKNQGSVEYMKDIYGIQHSWRHHVRTYFGETWLEIIAPWNPRRTHNYLEWTYTLKNLSFRNQMDEVTKINKSNDFKNYFVLD